MFKNYLPKYGQSLARQLSGLLDLFYPNLCLACSANLVDREEFLCVFCRHKLPLTNYHLLPENPFTERFWGRLPLKAGASLYHFTKGGRVQQLIHQLKYHHQPEVGYQLGLIHGRQIKDGPQFAGLDLIVPVPLHPRRQHQRGYNQSDHYARGLAEAIGIEWSARLLQKNAHTATQTRKSRLERFDNVGEVFHLPRPDALSGKHLLLVDDVITTGATLEACGQVLLRAEGVQLSMATIAFAN